MGLVVLVEKKGILEEFFEFHISIFEELLIKITNAKNIKSNINSENQSFWFLVNK